MNFDDYEALPNSKLSIILFAGACAGIMEHVVMYPVDTIKVSLSSSKNLLRLNNKLNNLVSENGSEEKIEFLVYVLDARK